ncbi:MAG: chitobiase/beta-hexosaminidase C-terminal domain-containing protein [Prevotella sp.]|nr:chitobiase/beta-hexosaminidase C-terminal domain-containing protein [Prevotella sp.]
MKRYLLLILFTLLYNIGAVMAQSGYGTGDDFNPDNPSLPGANGLYLDKGFVVLDGLRGTDYEAIDEVIYAMWQRYCDEKGYDKYSNERSSEHMLEVFDGINTVIVCGDFSNHQDYTQQIGVSGEIGSFFRQMTTLDLSRTYGWTVDYSLANGDYLSNLEVLILPDCVQQVVSMQELHRLTDVYCYAELPPVLQQWNAYYSEPLFADDVEVKVHVPQGAVDLYKASETWGKYSIFDIETTVGKMEVKMPQGVDIGQYRNMFLTLTDEQSQQQVRYVITDRQNYFFPGLGSGEGITYSVALVNRFGTVVCQQTGIKPQIGITTVQLKDPLPVTTATAKVLSPAGDDVTSMVTLTWYDAYGDRITSSPVLAGLVAGDELQWDVLLPTQLAQTCAQPGRQKFTVANNNTLTTLRLQSPKKHSFVGFVRDADTGMPLHEISVTAIQTVAEGVTNTYSSLSYNDGRIIVQCYEGPLRISLSSSEYLRKDLEYQVFSSTPESNQIGDIRLQRANGKTITLDLTISDAVLPDETATSLPLLDSSQDLIITATNEYTEEPLRNISVQYPQVVILSGADDDDLIHLDIASASGDFDPYHLTVQMSEGKGVAKGHINRKGGFQSTFSTTRNASVAAILYDSEGRYVRQYLHQKATITVKGLEAGQYTLVTMAYDPVLSQLTSLEAFDKMGLRRDIDYLQCDLNIDAGTITPLSQGEVPVIDVEELKIVHPSSTLSISQTQVTLGDYAMVRARVKVKNEIAQNSWSYDNFRLLFDLPADCPYLEGSLMVDGNVVTPEYEDHRLLVRTEGIEEGKLVDVRFCLVGKTDGRKTVSALVGYRSLSWTDGNKDYYAPVGATTFVVNPLEYSIDPHTTGNLAAVGKAPKGSTISAFDSDILLTQTTLTGNMWTINMPLPQDYNLSLHPIRIECVTKEGNVYNSPVTNVLVNHDMNRVAKVTMLYPNAYTCKTIVCAWDFINPDDQVESYDFDPSSRDFTFLIDFLRNDTSEVGDVVLQVEYSDGKYQELRAAFDDDHGCWLAKLTMPAVGNYPPAGVAVAYNDKKNVAKLDRQHTDDIQQQWDDFIALCNRLTTIMAGANENNIDEKVTAFVQEMGAPLMGETTDEMREWRNWYDSLTPDEAEAEIDGLLDELEEVLALDEDYLNNIMQPLAVDIKGSYPLGDGQVMIITDCSAYSQATMPEQGFEAIEGTDGSTIYIRYDSNSNVVVDFQHNIAIEISGLQTMNGPRRGLAETLDSIVQKVSEIVDKVTQAYDETLKAITSSITELQKKMNFLTANADKLNRILADPNAGILKKGACRVMLAKLKLSMTSVKIGLKYCEKLPGVVKKVIPLASYVATAIEFAAKCKELKAIDKAIPRPCKNDEANATAISGDIGATALKLLGYTAGKLTAQAAADVVAASGVVASIGTAGASLLATAGAYVVKVAAFWAADKLFEGWLNNKVASLRTAVSKLKCKKEEEEGKEPDEEPEDPGEIDRPRPKWRLPRTPRKRPLIDPSGFVCEAVESNRLEGVTATCFYKKEVEDMFGDKHEEVTIWDAWNYGQQNPLLTDNQGMYAWMVPTGQWQVLYEKEGYETQRSAWLPVPPPQLDVNVGMVRRAQPELVGGAAYEKAIDIDFSLYMKQQYITPQTITFWQDGQQISGQLEAINGETAFGSKTSTENGTIVNSLYASSFRFATKKSLAVGSQVVVRASALCRSYADVALGQDMELTLTVGREVTGIGAEDNIVVPYGGTHQVVITAQSPKAAAFRKVAVSSLSPEIAQLETNEVILDAQGQAYLTITGRLPGTTYLTFAIDGTQVKGMDTVRVVSDLDVVPAPRADIISGMYVAEGTKVALTAASGCTIWYTLDGSCPCEEGTRQQYAGPITIKANTTLKAMAVDAQGRESEVVTFTWFVSTSINQPVAAPLSTGTIYDLQGRRLQQPAKGINIIDGKKIAK